jgi:DNA ligase (NAD+)
MVRETIVALNQLLTNARQAYYVAGEPIMSDAEFDTKEAELRGLITAHPDYAPLATVLNTVGSDLETSENGENDSDLETSENGSRVQHIQPMLSIENNYSKEDVVEWCRQFPDGTTFCIEPKRDGISCELRYRDGKLVQAVTRGTGTEGEDMTAQVLALNTIPKSLPTEPAHDLEIAYKFKFPRTFNVRGELAMRDSELKRLNAEAEKVGGKLYTSTRNLTAGTMKKKDLSVVASREVVYLPWDVYAEDETDMSDMRALRLYELNAKYGFEEHQGIVVNELDKIIPTIDQILEHNSKSDIRADGVVIKIDSVKLSREVGNGSKFANYQTCFKPQSESGTTYLRDVVWQVGRSGKVTPVAICDPVVLAGACVERAILNNLTWIENLGLTIGSKVEMLRSGDVIPQIIRVIDTTGTPIVPPTNCPECGSELKLEAPAGISTLSCENGECPGRASAQLAFIGKREVLEIDGLAEEMAGHLVREGYARNIGELVQFQMDALRALNKVGEEKFIIAMNQSGFTSLVVKMVRSMETAKAAPWDRWITALGIPLISQSLGKVLATSLKLDVDSMKELPAKLEYAAQQDIEGIGKVRADILLRWAKDPVNQQICQALYDCGVRPASVIRKVDAAVGEPLKGVAFVITGEFAETRESIEAKLTSLGAVSKSGVSKKVTHLIVGEAPGGSKLKKYQELKDNGCPIQKVGQEWLEKVLAEAGMPLKGAQVFVEEA